MLLYNRPPLGYDGSIPLYSAQTDYTDNYERISRDHLQAVTETSSNPFIEDQLWSCLETSTIKHLQAHLKAGQRLLDVGVGTARILSRVPEYSRFGIDISLEYLRRLSDSDINIAYSTVEDMPYSSNIFDGVLCTDVLEHVLDLHSATKQIYRILRPGGFLILRVPYKENLDVYLNDNLDYKYIHLRSFDLSSLRLHFEKIIKFNYIESSIVCPYNQGPTRFKLQLLEPQDLDNILHILHKHAIKSSPLHSIPKVSMTEICGWMISLQKENITAYNLIAPLVLEGLEINAVFQKSS